MLEHLGLEVNRLIRVSFGPFQLGDLADGEVEEVKTRHLREQLGERIAGRAGADFSTPAIPAPKGEGGGRRPPGGAWRNIPPPKGEGGGRRPPGGGLLASSTAIVTPPRRAARADPPLKGRDKKRDQVPTRSASPTTLPRKRGRDKKKR